MNQYQQPARYGAGGTGQGGASQGSGRRFPTASYLSANVRESMIQQLNRTLADATVLQKQAKFAHWNVKGMAFYGLHELFDDLAAALADHVDQIAERITALGGQAMGTAGQAVASRRIPAMPTDVVTGPEYVDVLTERLAVFDANIYGDIQAATELGDLDTADLLNEVSRDVSTYLWFVEAHRQTEPVGTTAEGMETAGTTRQGAQPVPARNQQATPYGEPETQGVPPQAGSSLQNQPREAAQYGDGGQSSPDRTDQLVAAEMQ